MYKKKRNAVKKHRKRQARLKRIRKTRRKAAAK